MDFRNKRSDPSLKVSDFPSECSIIYYPTKTAMQENKIR